MIPQAARSVKSATSGCWPRTGAAGQSLSARAGAGSNTGIHWSAMRLPNAGECASGEDQSPCLTL